MGCIVVLILSLVAVVLGYVQGGYWRSLWVSPFILMWGLVWWSQLRHRSGRSMRRWLRARLGLGLSVDELARRCGCSPSSLRNMNPQYREVHIPKRRGGTRLLQVPDAATKALQRTILHRVLSRLSAHPAAHAFEKGRSIVTQAQIHIRQAVVLKCDVVDFFPSTTRQRIERWFRDIGWNREAAALLARLTTHGGGLPQGAPTSPRLANLVNYMVDYHLSRYVAKFRGNYTRYADDITISFPEDWPRKVRGTRQYVQRIFRGAGYRLHGRTKGGIFRYHQRQEVTGLIVNDDIQVPRERRRRLRAVRHHLANGKTASLTEEQLAGWDSYLAMVAAGRGTRPIRERGRKMPKNHGVKSRFSRHGPSA